MERFRCCHSHDFAIEKERFKDDGIETHSSEEQVIENMNWDEKLV